MPRPRKYPLPEKSNSSENAVETDIEPHAETDILQQADKLLNQPKEELSRNQKYKRGLKERKSSQAEDFQTIIAMLITLGLSAWSVPDTLKPNDDEVQAFSVPAVRMLLRHVPIVSRLSADALDVIGMIGALSAYSVRTRADWQAWNTARNQMREAEKKRLEPENNDDPFAYHTPLEPQPANESPS